MLQATPQPAVRHDTAYDSSFVYGRGNLVWIGRYDVTDPNNSSKMAEHKWGYYETGTVTFDRDALGHQTSIEYADSFSDGTNRNTFAYPTKVTDEEQRWLPTPKKTLTEYNFDFGAVTKVTGLSPNAGQAVPYQTYIYDSAARIQRITNSVNGAYTRWVYPTTQTLVQTFTTVVSGAGEAYAASVLDGAGRVRAEASDHPNSNGGYRGQYFVYDIMGRAVQQSNPTEMTSAWSTVGDDSAWIYTRQTYDWKGRPTVTTNADNTTRENTYGGCGCAGGEVVTAKDESGRRRRMTMDVVGRLSKVEELNYDQSVYSTTNYAYNVRDQITSITQQNSRTRTFDYDGHGRLWHKTTPEQGTTTYGYFQDDLVQTLTDARGATTTFAYNGRHLVTGITYGAPGSWAATPNVSFAYDVAGNRTSMTDGLGSVSYVYDQLSRLTSETRTFTGVTGSFPLTYQYNLAGGLTNIRNPWTVDVGYLYDRTGRVNTVTGAGYAGAASYVSNISYRAFDAAKQISYANGKALSLQYNNRLMLTQWNIPGVLGYNYSYNYFNENTGRVTFASNVTNGGGRDATLDHSYSYDQVGRLGASYTGTASLAHTGQGSTWGGDGPYAQTFAYDVWGNITSRAGWGGWNAQYSASFNNKNRILTNPANGQAFTYDGAGNITYDGSQTFTYDAAGKQVTSSTNGLQQGYDGNGLRGKKVMGGVATYYLRSSALGGQVVAEIDANGGWSRGYVYLGGQMLAIQFNSSVTWVHQEPMTKGQRLTNSAGNVTSTIELDPFGGDTSRSVNSLMQPHAFTSYERDTTGVDEAMARRYHGWWSRFDQPDPFDGSYDFTDPQSFNRYTYTHNDPVNHIDPSGLEMDLTLGCSAQFSSCYGGGGGGYSGTPFDSYSIIFGGYDEVPPSIRPALAAHDQWVWRKTTEYRLLSRIPKGLTDPNEIAAYFAAMKDLLDRIESRPECAELYGRVDNALGALAGTQFSVYSQYGSVLQPGGDAYTSEDRSTISINRLGGFFTSGQVQFVNPFPPNQTYTVQENTLGLRGADYGALVLGHELGHVADIYGRNDKDTDQAKNDANTQMVYDACFK